MNDAAERLRNTMCLKKNRIKSRMVRTLLPVSLSQLMETGKRKDTHSNQELCLLYRDGASVVHWSDHSPFTSKVPSSIPNKVMLMWTRTQSLCEKSIVNALPKVVGFLRVLRFPPTGKVDWVG